MPEGPGVRIWPRGKPNCAVQADGFGLPFKEAVFDQALLAHALEFAEPPRKLLRELISSPDPLDAPGTFASID